MDKARKEEVIAKELAKIDEDFENTEKYRIKQKEKAKNDGHPLKSSSDEDIDDIDMAEIEEAAKSKNSFPQTINTEGNLIDKEMYENKETK